MALREEVARAVNAGLRDGCGVRPHDKTWEVDALVGLFRTGLPELQRVLAKELPGLTPRVAGVFCHGRPKVQFTSGRYSGQSCELGDLLLVVRYRTSDRSSTRALLLQTKIGNKPSYPRSRSKEHRQVVLYTQWPRFTFFGGLARDVRPRRPHPGGRYGFLDICDGGCPYCSVGTAIPRSVATQDLADLIVGMLFQAEGRETVLPPAPEDKGWDRVVWDLLKASVDEVFRWKRANVFDDERVFPAGFLSRVTSEVPLLLEQVAESEEFLSGHALGARDFSLADAIRDEGLGPPGGDQSEALALIPDDPDRGLSVAVIEIEPT